MNGRQVTSDESRRLRQGLIGFFALLAIPFAALVWQARQQLAFEAFYDARVQAEILTAGIDQRLGLAMAPLATLAPDEFAPLGARRSASRVAAFPVVSDLPGLLGYFEIGEDGFHTPMLPASDVEAEAVPDGPARRALANRLREILVGGDDSHSYPAATAAAPADRDLHSADVRREEEAGASREDDRPARDSVNVDVFEARLRRSGNQLQQSTPVSAASDTGRQGKVSELRLDDALQQQAANQATVTGQEIAAEALEKAFDDSTESDASAAPSLGLSYFGDDVDAYRLVRIDDSHAALIRNVWLDNARRIQGAILHLGQLVDGIVDVAYRASPLSAQADLVVGYDDDILRIVNAGSQRNYPGSASELDGSLLHRARLAAPFQGFELVLSVADLPPAPGSRLVTWTAVSFAALLLLGFVLFYRTGLRRIQLARQQSDFVSAVSHELKTPLTSIRMYGEMLQQGWTDEDRRQRYYEFIHDEAERLTRLIDNVLALSRMSRGSTAVDLRAVSIAELGDLLQSKLADRVAAAGFELELIGVDRLRDRQLMLDPDAFLQVAINLVDNALKFAAEAAQKSLRVSFEELTDERICIAVRDYGPGVPDAQTSRIFDVFYRPESEQSRAAPGTGIGLAIVRALTEAMHGEVSVHNCGPGAEFRLVFPAAAAASRS